MRTVDTVYIDGQKKLEGRVVRKVVTTEKKLAKERRTYAPAAHLGNSPAR